MKVPGDGSPGWGVVVCRGESYNIWWSVASHPTEYTILTEAEAQLEGLKMKPGTLNSAGVDSVQTRLMQDYGIDLKEETMVVDGTEISVYDYILNKTRRVQETLEPWFHSPFDVRRWR